MSILLSDNLRYIKRIQLEQEQKLMFNYYQDLIRSYGVDVLYIKRDNNFITSGTNSDIIYGHQTNPKYMLSANMITYMEVDSSVLALNGLGIIPQDELTFYFSINDFAVAFANEISQYKEYPIATLSGYLPYTATTISKSFSSEVIEGTFSYNLSSTTSGANIHIEPPTSGLSDASYSVITNPYIHSSFSSLIQGGYVNPNLFLTYNKGTYKNQLKTFYTISGYVLYSDLELALKNSTKIRPYVGDIVLIDFPGGEQQEQYEINEIVSRKPTSNDGLNPLLGKYVYKCKAIRRIASQEEVTNIDTDAQAEKYTENMMDIIKKTQHDKETIFKNINDYSETTDDEVYGGYESASALIKDPDIYAVDTFSLGSPIIQDFNNNTSILTDGNNLYFQHDATYSSLTNNTPLCSYTEFDFPQNIPQIMYLKIRDGNIYFSSSIDSGNTYITNKLTNFTNETKKEQYSFDYIIKDVNQKYNLNNNSVYIFKSDRFLLYSTGLQLKAVNPLGEEYIIYE